MHKRYLYFAIGLLAAVTTVIYSCKKVNGFDNNNVIETPFSLYFADSGRLLESNDGSTFVKTFSADGLPSRALITTGDYILWCKGNLYYSANNGYNIDQAYDSVQYAANIAPWLTTACNGFPIDLNQSMLVDVPGNPDLIYIASDQLHAPLAGSNDYLGVAFNNINGLPGYWSTDNGYDTVAGQTGPMPVNMVSFVLMPNGYLLGLAVSPASPPLTGVSFRNFYNTNPSNYASAWEECTGSSGTGIIIGGTNDTSGYSLPPNADYLTDTSFFTLGNYNARAIAIDQKGNAGAWYSDDNGRTWAQYSGLPAKTPLLCIASPFNQVCMIGTDRAGLYMLNITTNTWQPITSGLTNNLVIRGIAAKENYYKDGSNQKYLYLATNQGIYQSTDMGQHWVLNIKGNYVSIY